MIHTSVLLQEAIDGLDLKAGDIFVDGTLGNGGHTEAIIQKLGDTVKIFAIDADADALARSKERLSTLGKQGVTYILGNFRDMITLLAEYKVEHVDKILLDIGLSSNQLEESGRGFAFRSDEPLNMSFKKEVGEDDLTAEIIVNEWDEDTLRTIIKAYGEERWAGRIARAIVRTRELTPIKTTTDLVNIILSATPAVYHRQRLHPATRTFQALRITVNDELQALNEALENGFKLLNSGGRMAVISFHSLEDRLVKNYFKTMESAALVTRVYKKPLTPKESEVEANPRSRSAKLRIIQKN
jgi:16S rRNA (cytosine1402-N4)-methyltransferase